MKYFSLALAFVVCAAVVSAAPSPSFEEFGFNPLEKINQKLQKYYEKFLCIREVIETNVENTEYEQDYKEFKEIVNTVFEDFHSCEGLKCKLEVIKDLPEYFVDYFKTLIKKNHELVENIHEEVNEKCFATQNMFAFEETLSSTNLEEFQCMVDVLGEVSKNNGLEEMWSHSQPIIQRHIDNENECPNAGNKVFIAVCYIRETLAIFTNLVEYLKLASQENPKFVPDFMITVKQKCPVHNDEPDIMFQESLKSFGVLEKIKCVNEAVGKAVKDTDFESVYDQIKKDLDEVVDHIKECKEKSNPLEVAKCVYAEVKLAKGKIVEFLRTLHETNQEAFERALEYIKKCTV